MFNFILLVIFSSALVESIPHFLNKLPQGHIVGGIDATIEEYPHQVAIYRKKKLQCGGSIYAKNVVISAAHCFYRTNPSNFKIYAGTTLLSERNLEFSISKVYNHEKYTSNGLDFDVAVLIIDGEFEFNNRIQPIALAETRPSSRAKVIVIGWGRTDEGTVSDQLQQVSVNVVDNKKCNEVYLNKITNNMICASVHRGGKDSCQRDSGGPLIFNKTLLGIVSWGRGCGLKGYPGVYASVPEFRDWILQTLRSHNAE